MRYELWLGLRYPFARRHCKQPPLELVPIEPGDTWDTKAQLKLSECPDLQAGNGFVGAEYNAYLRQLAFQGAGISDGWLGSVSAGLVPVHGVSRFRYPLPQQPRRRNKQGVGSVCGVLAAVCLLLTAVEPSS